MSITERRKLAKFPNINTGTVFDGTAREQFEKIPINIMKNN